MTLEFVGGELHGEMDLQVNQINTLKASLDLNCNKGEVMKH
jgi:hypothetical protein